MRAVRTVTAYRRITLTAALVLALGACGVRGSDVVEAGDAATLVVHPAPALRMTLFYVGPDGRLLPVVREGEGVPESTPDPTPTHPDGEPVHDRSEGDPGRPLKALAALLAGPTEAERAVGLRTRLPVAENGNHALFVSEDPVDRGEGDVPVYRVRYMGLVTDLDPLAVQQIVCTTVFAKHPAGLVSVALTGPDGALPTQSCPGTETE
ncbi:hypothetical protein [Streptomyces sp. NPDC054975]